MLMRGKSPNFVISWIVGLFNVALLIITIVVLISGCENPNPSTVRPIPTPVVNFYPPVPPTPNVRVGLHP